MPEKQEAKYKSGIGKGPVFNWGFLIALAFIIAIPSTRWTLFKWFTFRFTPSEFFGILCLAISLLSVWGKIKLTELDKAIMLFAGLATLGSFFSLNPIITALEASIIWYFFFLSKGLVLSFDSDEKLKWVFRVLISLAIIVPGLALTPYFRPVASIFLNAGEAGDFYFYMLTFLIPLSLSSYRKIILPTAAEQILLLTGILLSTCLLFVSIKISAVIGLSVSLFFLLLYLKKYKVIGTMLVFTLIVLALVYAYPSFYLFQEWTNQLAFKWYHLTSPEGVYLNMYSRAWQAFLDHPLIGIGLSAFNGAYFNLEIHSSYLKILTGMGLIGLVTYGVFVKELIKVSFSKQIAHYRQLDPYSQYLWLLQPFLIGHSVTWIYTYQFRKREFWLLLSILLAIDALRKHKQLKLPLSTKDKATNQATLLGNRSALDTF